MKMTTRELKTLIKEALKEELGRKPARKIRESFEDIKEIKVDPDFYGTMTIEEIIDDIKACNDNMRYAKEKVPVDIDNIKAVGVTESGYILKTKDGKTYSITDRGDAGCRSVIEKPSRRGLREDTINGESISHNPSSPRTLADFYRKHGGYIDIYDVVDSDTCPSWFNEWLNIAELARIASQANYDRLKAGKEVLVLHGNDLGDGHGDMMAYFYGDGKNLYFQIRSSNDIIEYKIDTYNQYKNHIYFEDLWQEVYFDDIDKYSSNHGDYYDLEPRQFLDGTPEQNGITVDDDADWYMLVDVIPALEDYLF